MFSFFAPVPLRRRGNPLVNRLFPMIFFRQHICDAGGGGGGARHPMQVFSKIMSPPNRLLAGSDSEVGSAAQTSVLEADVPSHELAAALGLKSIDKMAPAALGRKIKLTVTRLME